MKFRKKPVVIDAVRWSGSLTTEMAEHLHTGCTYTVTDDTLNVQTLEGVMAASPGDWIIRGVKGEFYPIKGSIFAETYESASDA